MTADEARDWWRSARRAWGRLQQVRRSTRVRCQFCGGRPASGVHRCPMCIDGFWSRDEAIKHHEGEMEMALQ